MTYFLCRGSRKPECHRSGPPVGEGSGTECQVGTDLSSEAAHRRRLGTEAQSLGHSGVAAVGGTQTNLSPSKEQQQQDPEKGLRRGSLA